MRWLTLPVHRLPPCVQADFIMHDDLTIDRNVRDWVFFPLIALIVLMNVLRQLAHQVCCTIHAACDSH